MNIPVNATAFTINHINPVKIIIIIKSLYGSNANLTLFIISFLFDFTIRKINITKNTGTNVFIINSKERKCIPTEKKLRGIRDEYAIKSFASPAGHMLIVHNSMPIITAYTIFIRKFGMNC